MRVARIIGVRTNGVRTNNDCEVRDRRRAAQGPSDRGPRFRSSQPRRWSTFSLSHMPTRRRRSCTPWGYNVDGQLGQRHDDECRTPVKVSLPAGVTATAAAAGANHSLAVGSDGKLYAWGVNTNGELGNGTVTSSTTPVVVSMPAGVTATAVAAGDSHSVALGSNGSVYDWATTGSASSGTTPRRTPTRRSKVTLPAGVTPIAVAGRAIHDRGARLGRQRVRMG